MQNNSIRLKYDRPLVLSVGNSRKSTDWKPWKTTVSELYSKLCIPQRGSETQEQYFQLKKGQQDDLKDIGGFVGGAIQGTRRKATAVLSRSVIALDLDTVPQGGWAGVMQILQQMGYSFCVYGTRKDRPAAPRRRIVMPASRDMAPDEYEPCARRLAANLGIQMVDSTCFQLQQLMYWPSCSADVEFYFRYMDAPLIAPETLLKSYTNWKDQGEWPRVPGEDDSDYKAQAKKQGDPTEKSGIIGAFCRKYDVPAAMDAFLPGVYAETEVPDRYTYTKGSTTGGAILYDDGKFLYSHHATDPCSNKLVNAFDMVRLHLFGDKDDGAAAGTPTAQLPSFKAMCEFAENDPGVLQQMQQERKEQAIEEFRGIGREITQDQLNAVDRLAKCIDQPISLPIVRDALMAKGWTVRRNVITGNTEVKGLDSSKYTAGNALNTLPVLLYDYLRTLRVKSVSDQLIRNYLGVIADENQYNPVAEMLCSVTWDSMDRLPQVYSMLGTITAFQKAFVHKWLIQCVAMAMNDPNAPWGADGVLTLQGEEGKGKTEFFRRLAVRPEWFAEGVSLDMQDKDSILRSINCWICELGELDSTSRRDQSALKSHLTATQDKIREPYGRAAITRPRRTSYCATVNPTDFLTGQTGNRRFWVIPISDMNLNDILKITPEWSMQLWGQMYRDWLGNKQGYRLTPEEKRQIMESNRQFQVFLPGEEELREMLDFELPMDKWKYFTAGTIAGILSGMGRQRISGQMVSRIIARVIQEHPEIEKKQGHARTTQYLLPLPYEQAIH